jgi:hypothetical protein
MGHGRGGQGSKADRGREKKEWKITCCAVLCYAPLCSNGSIKDWAFEAGLGPTSHQEG